ncbi:imidazole glycerol phosphate synthase subunit HisH [Leptospira sp. GIMC2001]|uniref:imidazole glycerol phosphate synthase subunit HisH n=1 Tax=Leptospira sp. GIMC2001 TaxID=1513297 RepID=UPI002349E02A|nr:imidazole glycerol phosphate synthase subunit HisH [Leptospira sp. GIMC2001]WCL48621.1 imidazole glycerol phosphate synthase subunit HisH [Leptospira sp. GIMC2001]
MIAVLDFGMGNIHSCLKAISLYSKDVIYTRDHDIIKKADKLVLPGDGAFAKAMSNLNDQGLTSIIQEQVAAGKPLLGICIGFQILFQDSDEDMKQPGNLVKGLGLVTGQIRRFREKKNMKVPHMGWNRLRNTNQKTTKLLKNVEDGSFMYFIHSYRPIGAERKEVSAFCNYYGESFPAVVEKGNVYGTQFHPEKSDQLGLKILENFVGL